MTSSRAAWWQSAVVYQIYPRSFCDASGNGIGDLAGIITRLDYLQQLGVDVLWLSPMFPSPQDDAGYDISDYQDIDPVFGTLAEFDRLLAELHRRGMKLVLDLVVNHTSDEHPWFQQSRSGRDDPKRDWYWWRGPRAGMAAGAPGAEPTNWASAFSGSAWQFDEASGEYYLHLFSRKQPDLNWENPQVRAAVYEMMRWWLARGVDGFRMDVINMISKDLAAGEFMHGPRLHEFVAEMHREALGGGTELLSVGEMPGVTVEEARLFTDPARAELDMGFQFEHVALDQGASKWDLVPLDLRLLKASLNRWQVGLADVGWNSLYWDNHDQPRAVSRFGDDSPEHRRASATCLATLLHLHRGTPYVYQGEELGMANTQFLDISAYRDIESVNYYAEALSLGMEVEAVLHSMAPRSRDNARTPMQWDDSSHAGFTQGIPWLPVNPNYVVVNAAAAVAEPGSTFHHFRRLIELRHELPVVVEGRFELLLPEHGQIWALTRTLGNQLLVMVANCSSRPVTVPAGSVPDVAGARLLLSTHPGAASRDLQPWESRIHLVG